MDAAVLIRLEGKRPAAQQSQEWVDRQMKKIHAGLKAMSLHLGERLFCPEKLFHSQILPLAVRLAGLNSVSRRSNGKKNMKICPNFLTGFRNALLSGKQNRYNWLGF